MLQAPILVPPNWSQRFFLYISAGGKALGVVLMQQDGNGVEHAMYFAGRMLNESELKYGAVEKEILALIYASKKLRHYLLLLRDLWDDGFYCFKSMILRS
eukprot:Gb_12421 [translate_table: standard]